MKLLDELRYQQLGPESVPLSRDYLVGLFDGFMVARGAVDLPPHEFREVSDRIDRKCVRAGFTPLNLYAFNEGLKRGMDTK